MPHVPDGQLSTRTQGERRGHPIAEALARVALLCGLQLAPLGNSPTVRITAQGNYPGKHTNEKTGVVTLGATINIKVRLPDDVSGDGTVGRLFSLALHAGVGSVFDAVVQKRHGSSGFKVKLETLNM